MMMEVEKPFKCTTCLARFTNEDHLQIHRRRHEMFLSFNNTSSGSRPSTGVGPGAGEMNFIDETPTPTRFFRIGDEIGLFQDIQHVNPFDEQFSQEVQSPSRRDLHLLDSRQHSPVTSGVLDDNDNNNMNYNQQPDVLNTPQVLDMALSMASQFQLRNTTSLSTTTTTISTSLERISPPSSITTPLPPMLTVTTDNELIRKEGFKDKNNFIEKKRKRARLTLNLPSSPSSASASDPCKSSSSVVSVIVENKSLKTNKTTNIISPPLPLQLPPSIPAPTNSVDLENKVKKFNSIKDKDHNKIEEDKKIELLERNRAAASRSRKRRNIWVNELEQRCLKLQTELNQVRNENVALKKQLSLHSNCDVTKLQNTSSSTNTNANIVKEVIDLTSSEILPNSDAISTNATKISFVNKPKRGRPRKGNVLFSKEMDILVSGKDADRSLPATAQKTVEVSKAKIAIPRLEKTQIRSTSTKSQPQQNVILNLTMDLSKNGPTILLNNCRSEK